MKVVLDTNIFVSALFWEKGNPRHIIEKALEDKFELITSDEILEELERILKRDFEADDVFCKNTTEFIRKIAAIINPVLRLEVINEDPDDNKILACADEGKADYIVTGDNHLLNLKKYNEIQIVKAKEFDTILNNQIES
ncbi:MAG TPA: putative toxin-antitoxin system toxin component, PIN family [Candidatus Nanoarchaeia archaeon]|nr:putative toxin-antitoxin system toxin component, PIN family [Candidatus Nanoarchaeia archaeon]